MRILQVWATAITLIFVVTLGWYVSQPAIIGVARTIATAIPGSPAQGNSIIRAVEYASFAFGPIMILFILLWAVVSSSKKDVESEIYG